MWVFGVLSAALVLLAAMLLVPLEVGFHLAREDRARGGLAVSWGFGLLRKELGVGPRGRPGGPRPRRKKRRGARARWGRNAARLRVLARTPGFPRRCGRLLRHLFRQVEIRELLLRGRVGLEDPADTGLLFGVLTPALCFLGAGRAVSADLAPDFLGPTLAVHARGSVRVVPARVIWVLVLFLLSPATLRAIRSLAARRGR